MMEGLRTLSEAGYAHFHYEVHEHLSSAYEALNDTASALHHHREYTRVKGEYINIEKSHEAGRAEMRKELRELAERLKKERSTAASLRTIVEQREAELRALTLNLIRDEERGKHHGDGYSITAPRANGAHWEPLNGLSGNWEAFARQFHKVHYDFYTNLIRRYPELTPAEIKVCSLIRIGLSSKEIAGVLSLSKKTIDKHRARIHRKLELAPRSSLAGFIACM